jgi:hypothetical protein
MHSRKQLVLFTAGLLAASAALYGLHYLLFHNSEHIFLYGLSELAFLPIEVLIVSLVIDRLLEASEKRAMLNKLNMVIGAFFSEVGTEFMRRVFVLDGNFANIRQHFIVKPEWTAKTFDAAARGIPSFDYRVRVEGPDLPALKEFLMGKREFMLRLLENPNLLEHEQFSELLWSVFHLTEELDARGDLLRLTPADYDHLALDTKRAYEAVLAEWLDYMKHLKDSYPYLFAMAVRTNPFDPNAKAELP